MSVSGSGFHAEAERPYAGLGPDDGPGDDALHRPILQYRVECSCGGWAGTLLGDEAAALSQHQRHVRYEHRAPWACPHCDSGGTRAANARDATCPGSAEGGLPRPQSTTAHLALGHMVGWRHH